jgi:hypothetical protein
MSEQTFPTINEAADSVINDLHKIYPDVPFFRPRHVAPLLGISYNALQRYCRRCKYLKNWKGSYMFFTDDPEHMDLLRHVIKLVLWSGRKLPAHLRYK